MKKQHHSLRIKWQGTSIEAQGWFTILLVVSSIAALSQHPPCLGPDKQPVSLPQHVEPNSLSPQP